MIDATRIVECMREQSRLLQTPIGAVLASWNWLRQPSGCWTLTDHHRLWTLDETARTLVVQHRQFDGWGRPVELPYPTNAAELLASVR